MPEGSAWITDYIKKIWTVYLFIIFIIFKVVEKKNFRLKNSMLIFVKRLINAEDCACNETRILWKNSNRLPEESAWILD